MSENNEPVSLGEWMITMLVLCIPLVNIIMILVWAFSSGTKPSKANFFKAYLVFVLIGAVLGFIFASSIIGMLSAMM